MVRQPPVFPYPIGPGCLTRLFLVQGAKLGEQATE